MTTITQPIRKTAIVTGGKVLGSVSRQSWQKMATMLSSQQEVESRITENLALLDKYGQSITYVKADISSSSDRKIPECTLEVYGRVDVLINNAGVSVKRVDLLEMTENLLMKLSW